MYSFTGALKTRVLLFLKNFSNQTKVLNESIVKKYEPYKELYATCRFNMQTLKLP